MKSIDNNKISGSQFIFTVACFIQASGLITSFLLGIVGNESILVGIGGLIFVLPILFIIVSIMKKFPHKTLIEINDIVFGKILGKIVSSLYIIFFVTKNALDLRNAAYFVQKTIMHTSPIPILLIMFALVCIFSVSYGIEVITRYNALFSVVAIIVAVIGFILLKDLFNIKHFFPMFQLEPIKYIQGINIIATLPLGELIAVLMITPAIKKSKKSIGKLFFWGIFIGLLYNVLVMATDIGVLGNTLDLFSIPTFETLRLISLGEALSRMEILFAIVFIILMFSKVSFMFYITIIAVCQFFNIKNFRNMIISLCIIVSIYALTSYKSNIDNAKYSQDLLPIVFLFFEMILPYTTFAIILIRKLGLKKGESQDNKNQENKEDSNKQEENLDENFELEQNA